MFAGTGGSETYTIGHVKELLRQGIPARIVTLGLGDSDGRDAYEGIPFKSMDLAQLAELDDTIVFINEMVDVKTKNPAHVIFHCEPPSKADTKVRAKYRAWTAAKNVIVTSNYSAGKWAEYLSCLSQDIHVVYPFAEPEFANVRNDRTFPVWPRVLYAGRLAPEKGIYVLLWAMHYMPDCAVTITDAGGHTPKGAPIKSMVQHHPNVNFIHAVKTRQQMAELIAQHDIVVMPTPSYRMQETFGMVSIEAQHVGRRVVASNGGGLPETDCGGLVLVKPNDPLALASGIYRACEMKHMSANERANAINKFSVQESVSTLLKALGTPAEQFHLPY